MPATRPSAPHRRKRPATCWTDSHRRTLHPIPKRIEALARILLTRPLERQAATRARLTERGHTVLAAPMLQHERVADPMPKGGLWAGILLTSAYATNALDDLPRQTPILATGKATATAAKTAGFTTAEHVDGAALDLAAHVNSGAWDIEPGPLLAPRAEIVAHDLAQLIERPVHPWTVYRMRSARHFPDDVAAAFERGEIDATLLTSPAIARAFAQCFAQVSAAARIPVVVTLSPAIRDALEQAWKRELSPLCHVSDMPREDALLAALDAALAGG